VSIYATLWEIQLPTDGVWAMDEQDWVRVYAQAVPAHIGHPSDYPDGDPYGDFLPPPVRLDETEEPIGPPHRAIVICGPLTTKGTARSPQEYVNPLLVLTGEEYESIKWTELFDRICHAIARHTGVARTTAVYFAPDGTITRLVEEDE
jgi:hypothetical protein